MANHTHLSHPKYRPDIDGLRAIAVLSVVAFHAFPGWMRGGFIGVDVFFVISGFLISTIIFENLEQGSFSFTAFYARRIKRIFPALILVLAATYSFGWGALFADEYKQLGKHIAAGAGFVSNFVLWHEVSYFDNSAETKPLLHLWSLGIEEQFYLVWPLLLWLAWKRKLGLLAVTLVVAAVSFYWNLRDVKQDITAAFYSPQTRFWELLGGSVLAWELLHKREAYARLKHKANGWLASAIDRNRQDAGGDTLANLFALSGFGLLLYGFWHIHKGLGFPGLWALVPVLGSVLVIAAGPAAWVNRTVLANRVAVWFGLISFPLYLWHWPILSFARIVTSEVPAWDIRAAAVVLSVALAWLTYQLVEKRIRFGGHGNVKVAGLALLMLMVGYAGYNTYARDGLAFRDLVKINASIKSGEDGGAGAFMIHGCGSNDAFLNAHVGNCVTDSRGTSRFALLGDSKAAALFPGLIRTSDEKGRWLFIGGAGPEGAPLPVISNADIYKVYQKFSVPAIAAIANNKDVEKVVLVAATRALFALANDKDIEDLPSSKNYAIALNGLENTVKVFAQAGKKVILVVDNPTLPHPEDCLNRRTTFGIVNDLLVRELPECVLPLKKHLALSSSYRALLNAVKSSFPDTVTLFDTTDYLCDVNNGICTHRKYGRFLYAYTDHISDFASGLVGKGLNAFLKSN